MTVSEGVAKFVKDVTFQKIPAFTLQKLKEQLYSLIGSMYAGSKTHAGNVIIETVMKEFSGGDGKLATIIPNGNKVPFKEAVTVNAATAMALDYDDYLFLGHTGVSSVPVSLALAENYKLSGKEFLTLQAIGNEVAGRVGAAAVIGPLNGQCWSFIHLASSACMTAKVLDLSVEQIVNAIGIAMTHWTFTAFRSFMGPHAKLFTSAVPCRIGMEAAYFAAYGMTGAPDVFESPTGPLSFYAYTPLPFLIDNSLGEAWVTDTISFKIYPGCGYIDPIADCIGKILEKTGPDFNYQDIEKVRIKASVVSIFMDDLSRPYVTQKELKRSRSHVALNFYVPYNVAIMLMDGKLTPEQFTEEKYTDPEVWKLAEKIKTEIDLDLTRRTTGLIAKLTPENRDLKLVDLGLSEFKVEWGAKVVVQMKDGTKLKAKQLQPIGTPGVPYAIENKLRQEALYIKMGDSQINKIIETVKNFEKLESIHEFIDLITLKS
ncbi:MAG: MmgE/PrpD family protein [Candidatus Helarchaeota archaeon]|nr:MmgE/PrpD family protein [Candidatus Helarchaeota archaeon]